MLRTSPDFIRTQFGHWSTWTLDQCLDIGPMPRHWTNASTLDQCLDMGPMLLHWTNASTLDQCLNIEPMPLHWTNALTLDCLDIGPMPRHWNNASACIGQTTSVIKCKHNPSHVITACFMVLSHQVELGDFQLWDRRLVFPNIAQ